MPAYILGWYREKNRFHFQQQATKLSYIYFQVCDNYYNIYDDMDYCYYYLLGNVGLHVAFSRPFSIYSVFKLFGAAVQ